MQCKFIWFVFRYVTVYGHIAHTRRQMIRWRQPSPFRCICISAILFLLLFSPVVSSDGEAVVVDAVCLIDQSSDPSSDLTFPTAVYDTVLQRISNGTLSSPTVVRVDLITGAEARMRYFPGNSTIRRFELLHVIRVRSAVRGGDSPSATVGRLRLDLTRVVAREVEGVVCGVDWATDPTASPAPAATDSIQWLQNLPAVVAPIALIGWIFTMVACLVCWFCVCCTAPAEKVPVATAVPVPSPPNDSPVPVTGVPINQPVQQSSGSATPNSRVATAGKAKPAAVSRPASGTPRAEFPSQIQFPFHPLPLSDRPLSPSIDFHQHHSSHQALRQLDLRIPSFREFTTL